MLLSLLADLNALLEKRHAVLLDGASGTPELKPGAEGLRQDNSKPVERRKSATLTLGVLGEELLSEALPGSTHFLALEPAKDEAALVRASSIQGPESARDGMNPETCMNTNPIDIIFRNLS